MQKSKYVFGIFTGMMLIFIIISCGQFINPGEFTEYFKSMKIASYKADKIALLPIQPDDTTDTGAYYSTNHFYNYLAEKYDKKVFADIDWVRDYDCTFVNDQLDFIDEHKIFDLPEFFKTDLGYDLLNEKYDALLIGRIDSVRVQFGLFWDSQPRSVLGWYSYSKLTCFLVSLTDGKIIWKCTAEGKDFYEASAYERNNPPPLDYALTNAIDKIVMGLPPELF